MSRSLTVALLGGGTVGAQVARLIASSAADLEQRIGASLVMTAVAVREPGKVREGIPAELISGDAMAVATSGVDIVVELIGGVEPARSLILAAMAAGSSVVTANKALLAADGATLHEAAAKHGVDLYFEASVAGAIPLLRPLRESLAGDRVTKVMGIVNGTTNYILTRMTEAGASYADALAEAQSLGYAERDPTADVEGYDAAAKAAILATVAFGAAVAAGDVYHEGIANITASDIAFAGRLGYRIKLLAIAAEHDDGTIGVRVHPAMVPLDHPLASVRDSYNAVFVEGAAAGNLMFYGRGAGGSPTASAVLGDVIDAAANLRSGSAATLGALRPARIRPIDDVESEYYLQLEVNDQPGVLAQVAAVFGQHGVSIRSMEQDGLGDRARIIFITHTARESDVQATLAELRGLPAVRKINGLLRVIGADS